MLEFWKRKEKRVALEVRDSPEGADSVNPRAGQCLQGEGGLYRWGGEERRSREGRKPARHVEQKPRLREQNIEECTLCT